MKPMSWIGVSADPTFDASYFWDVEKQFDGAQLSPDGLSADLAYTLTARRSPDAYGKNFVIRGEAVFTALRSAEEGRAFYKDVKGRAVRAGRNPDHIKILPGCMVYVGDSLEEAREKRARLDSMVHYDSAIGGLSNEVKEKLARVQPRTLGQAGRIEGMTPGALTALLAYVKRAPKASVAA